MTQPKTPDSPEPSEAAKITCGVFVVGIIILVWIAILYFGFQLAADIYRLASETLNFPSGLTWFQVALVAVIAIAAGILVEKALRRG